MSPNAVILLLIFGAIPLIVAVIAWVAMDAAKPSARASGSKPTRNYFYYLQRTAGWGAVAGFILYVVFSDGGRTGKDDFCDSVVAGIGADVNPSQGEAAQYVRDC